MKMIRNIAFFAVLSFISVPAAAQQAKIVRLPALQRLIAEKDGRIKVFNFWATWCAPCVKEMPFFEKLNEQRQDVHVYLVSMDIDLDPDVGKVEKFIVRKKLMSEVLLLDERNPNNWISSIDKSWSGALPATLIVNDATGKRRFVERELHEGELEKLIAEIK